MLPALIERLEKAEEGSRVLDREIVDAVLGVVWKPYRPKARLLWGFSPDESQVLFYSEGGVPQYTSSIDAALALVSDEVRCDVLRGSRPFGATAWVDKRFMGCSPKPALAICIAALKARAAATVAA